MTLSPPAPPTLLTIPEAAKAMGVSEHTVYNYIMRERLQAYCYGEKKHSLWRIAQQDIDAFWNLDEARARAKRSIAMAGKKQIRKPKVPKTDV